MSAWKVRCPRCKGEIDVPENDMGGEMRCGFDTVVLTMPGAHAFRTTPWAHLKALKLEADRLMAGKGAWTREPTLEEVQLARAQDSINAELDAELKRIMAENGEVAR